MSSQTLVRQQHHQQHRRPATSVVGQRQRSTTTTVTQEEAVVLEPSRRKLVFGWVQDTSGSMAGARLRASIDGFRHMFAEVLDPRHDMLGLITFSDQVEVHHSPMPVGRIDMERDVDTIEQRCGGRTALFDALGTAIEGLRDMHRDTKYQAVTTDAVYELLLVTDGEDTSSTRYTLESLADLVAEPGIPHFHLLLVGVGMEPSFARILRQTLCAPRHATYFDASSIDDLTRTLKEVAVGVQRRLVVTTTTTRTAVVGGSGRGSRQQQQIATGPAAGSRVPRHRTPVRRALPAPPPPSPQGRATRAGPRPSPQRTGGQVGGERRPRATSTGGRRGSGSGQAIAASGRGASKDVVCRYWREAAACPFGDSCHFAHHSR